MSIATNTKADTPKILIKTPRTSNGRDLIMGEDGKRVFKETIVEAAARPIFEKQNEQRPTPLKHIIEDYPAAKPDKPKEDGKK